MTSEVSSFQNGRYQVLRKLGGENSGLIAPGRKAMQRLRGICLFRPEPQGGMNTVPFFEKYGSLGFQEKEKKAQAVKGAAKW